MQGVDEKEGKVSLATRITAMYVFLGGLWIIVTDYLLRVWIPDDSLITPIQTFKGWGFVLVTGTFLWLLIRRAEKQQLQKERAYRLVFRLTGSAKFVIGDDQTVQVVNKAAEDLLGYARSDFEGKIKFEDLVHEDCIEIWHEILTSLKTQDEPEPVQEPFWLVHRDGSKVEGLLHAATHPGDQANVLTFDDLTAYKALERRQEQMERMNALGRMARGVAHDFNNLLTVIGSYATFIQESETAGERIREDAREIVEVTRRASTLTQRILTFGQEKAPEASRCGLDAFIRELEPMLKAAVGHEIELELDLCADRAMVNAVPSKLEQVLVNLAVNARDAMPDGGHLRLGTQVLEVKPVEVMDVPDLSAGRYAQILVEDTGVGIPDEELPYVFEPFYTTKKPAEGNGLGLAIVYGVLRQSGAHITVSSREGEGTRFEILWPMAE